MLVSICKAHKSKVNMFGTTETQRAVSYYELPSRHEDPKYIEQMPDVIPAGKFVESYAHVDD